MQYQKQPPQRNLLWQNFQRRLREYEATTQETESEIAERKREQEDAKQVARR